MLNGMPSSHLKTGGEEAEVEGTILGNGLNYATDCRGPVRGGDKIALFDLITADQLPVCHEDTTRAREAWPGRVVVATHADWCRCIGESGEA